MGGGRATTKSGTLKNGLREGAMGGTLSRNLEILHVLKCVLGAAEALFHAHTQYIYIPASCCGFMSKSTT